MMHRTKMPFASSVWLKSMPKLVHRSTNSEISNYKRFSINSMINERPQLINAILERACNLQCRHCLLLPEKISFDTHLPDVIKNLVNQLEKSNLPPKAWRAFLHEGRIVLPWHIEFLSQLRVIAPNVQLGLIDNGTYVKYLEDFKKQNIKLDWLDISCDGKKRNHNSQRDPIRQKSYGQMIEGLRHGREITLNQSDGGRVTSLMTLTNINYNDVSFVAKTLFGSNSVSNLPYIDELHVTTMTPYQPENFKIEITAKRLRKSFDQTRKLHESGLKIYFRLYSAKHLNFLAEQLGYGEFRKAFETAICHPHGIIQFNILGLPLFYMPNSIWAVEGIFIDANCAQRVAYAQSHTLDQLNDPKLKHYTVNAQLNKNSLLGNAHKSGVSTWCTYFAPSFLEEELSVFGKILEY